MNLSSTSDEVISPIIINSSNLVPNQFNNRFSYSFPSGSVQFSGSRLCVNSINMYYSWFNISAAEDNNEFKIVHPTFAGSTTLTITMSDGFYNVAQINAYLQSQLILAGLYLVNGAGDNVYYCSFTENSVFYAVQYDSYEVPLALPGGYSNPGGMTFPAAPSRPQLTVLSNGFSDTIGFTPGTYPTAILGTDYSKLSDITPQLSPVQSVILLCNLLNNKYSNPTTILYSFTSGNTPFGNIISSEPSEFSYVSIQDGSYNSFEIQFVDQNLNDITLQDTNITVMLNIKN